ncbi:MAG: fibronectin type III domain-containing protein [Rhodocyclales bacterium]|nr:fibronectin type III domain-containing protein [Rhodocyclales bacterium]
MLAPNLANYVDGSVNTNALYSYQVGAVYGATNGAVSQVYALSATAPTSPSALSVGNATTTSLRLSWPASSSAYVTGYEIQRCRGSATVCAAGSANWQPLTTVNGRMTARYTDTGLTPRTNYRYRIRALVSVLPGVTSVWRTGNSSTR